MLKRFQSAFLDAMARYCDEYMRSPQFLAVMKQSMDGALSLRQQPVDDGGRIDAVDDGYIGE